uniref:Uncharacterized protein n=1 Tax=Lynx canadensis TaxID=61383 RepID=A0A667GH24_LYNCA
MKLDINHKKIFGKVTNTWRLKNILLKNEWTNQEVKVEIKKYMEVNKDDNTTTQSLWDAAKAVIRRKYIAIQAFLKKEERSQIHNLTLCPKEVVKEEQIKPKTSRRQEIIKTRAEINAIEPKTQHRLMKLEAGYLKELTKLINH